MSANITASQLQQTWKMSFLGGRSFFELSVGLVIFALLMGLSRVVYLLYFHPLASFPGPHKAALSRMWMYSLSKSGKVEEVLEQLHKKYNTRALRIGPNELHLTDPSLYHTIYSQRYNFPKQAFFYNAFNTPHTAFIETDKDLHHGRRKLLNKFFSKTSIRSMDKALVSKIRVLCDRISDSKGKGAINIHHAFRCLTVDFITDVAFGKSFDLLTEAEDNTFNAPFIKCFDLASESLWTMQYLPILRVVADKCPRSVASLISKSAGRFQDLVRTTANAVANFRHMKASGKTMDREVVFDSLQHLDDRLVLAEAMDILVAGSDTTAFTLATAVEYMIKDPSLFERLRKELRESNITPDQDVTLFELEQLPYLTAFVKESLRIAMPVPGRLPRVVPHGGEPLIVDEKVIPAGASVGISAHSVHFDESIWGEDARKFNPDRWLTGDAKELDKYLVTFSKGARQCLGINLAYAEVTLTLAILCSRFRFEFDETMTEFDLRRVDYFTHAFEGTGLRAIVHEDGE